MEPEGDSAKGRQVTSYGAEPVLGGQKGYCQLYSGHQAPARRWDPPMGLSVTLCSEGKGLEKSLVETKLSLREGLLVISAATLFGLLENCLHSVDIFCVSLKTWTFLCCDHPSLVVSRTNNHFLKPKPPISVVRQLALGSRGMHKINECTTYCRLNMGRWSWNAACSACLWTKRGYVIHLISLGGPDKLKNQK